jgi:lantibiotic biosynthesis protein
MGALASTSDPGGNPRRKPERLAEGVELLRRADAACSGDLETYASAVAASCEAIEPAAPTGTTLNGLLVKPSGNLRVSHQLLAEVAIAVDLLQALTSRRDAPLAAFARVFEERYQDAEVPILEALDEDTGIVFDPVRSESSDATPVVHGLPFNEESRADTSWTRRERRLLRVYAAAIQHRLGAASLSDEDVLEMRASSPRPLPRGLTALTILSSRSSSDLDDGMYQLYVQGVYGTSCGSLLARFGTADADLRDLVQRAILEEEANEPGFLHAEIAHLAPGRAGNVVMRPSFREFEIPLLGGSRLPLGRQIPLADLAVSVRDGSVRLRSMSRNRYVLPHLTCAHAFRNGTLGIYKFLASLDSQGAWSPEPFSWGPLRDAPFLPRLTYGRHVLALARWLLDASEVHALRNGTPAERFCAAQHLRESRSLPRLARFVERDNTLLVDFDNALSLDAFAFAVDRDARNVHLEEQFPDHLVARGEDGHFHHELAVPLINREPALFMPERPLPAPISNAHLATHATEWLYVKVYCGTCEADRLLLDAIAPTIASLREERLIDRWFYVRYGDPEWHLRIRVRGNREDLWSQCGPRLCEASLVGSPLRRVVVDRYKPEVSRYGGPATIDLAEQLFEADSDASVALLRGCYADAIRRCMLTAYSMRALLDDLRFSVEESLGVVEKCRMHQLSRYQNGATLTRALGAKYRELRSAMDAVFVRLQGRPTADVTPIDERSHRLSLVREALLRQAAAGCVSGGLAHVAGSYLHMSANRMLRGSINQHELVIYDCLKRQYNSQLARARHGARRSRDDEVSND